MCNNWLTYLDSFCILMSLFPIQLNTYIKVESMFIEIVRYLIHFQTNKVCWLLDVDISLLLALLIREMNRNTCGGAVVLSNSRFSYPESSNSAVPSLRSRKNSMDISNGAADLTKRIQETLARHGLDEKKKPSSSYDARPSSSSYDARPISSYRHVARIQLTQ